MLRTASPDWWAEAWAESQALWSPPARGTSGWVVSELQGSMAPTRLSMHRPVDRLGIARCQAGQRSVSLRPLPGPSLTCNGILGSATALPGPGAQV